MFLTGRSNFGHREVDQGYKTRCHIYTIDAAGRPYVLFQYPFDFAVQVRAPILTDVCAKAVRLRCVFSLPENSLKNSLPENSKKTLCPRTLKKKTLCPRFLRSEGEITIRAFALIEKKN
jgi:hypothetical protein